MFSPLKAYFEVGVLIRRPEDSAKVQDAEVDLRRAALAVIVRPSSAFYKRFLLMAGDDGHPPTLP